MNSSSYDVIIIGAGAAGLAAGRALHDAGQNILILEARNRIGGRIWTDEQFADFPVELGAEFIHGETAATHDLVDQAGLNTIPVVRMGNLRWGEGGKAALPRERLSAAVQEQLAALFKDYADLSDQHADSLDKTPPYKLVSQDMSLRAYFQSRGASAEALDVADVLFAQTCCAASETLSCADMIREGWVDHAGKEEFRIREGYRNLLEDYSRALPIRLNMPISAVQWDRSGVTVAPKGETFHARRCIITLPVSVLQNGNIQFEPPLSETKQQALAAFRTEPATKLIYRFNQPFWDDNLTFMAHTGLAARWWTPGYGRAGAAVIGAYITASRAAKIDAMSENSALETGLNELSQLLGVPFETLKKNLIAAKRVSWAQDPYALGGYAHLPPGKSDARPALAQPEGDVLFFAGEATAWDTNPQTVHGALESGWRAARECGV